MARPRAEITGAARVAIVGAETPDGHLVRDALAQRKLPGDRVDLYATVGGEAVISEYAGEARLIQDPDMGEISSHEAIFLCERGDLSTGIAAMAKRSTLIDLADAIPARDCAGLVSPSLNVEPGLAGCYTMPHAITLILVELLRDLQRGIGIEEVVATVLRPAADHGDAGLDELRQQTVSLLSFAEIPTDTFGSQLAFNVIPSLSPEGAGLEGRIASELQTLLGWDRPRATLCFATVPVFHGHFVRMRVRAAGGADADEVRQLLAAVHGLGADSATPPPTTPVEVVGEGRVALFEVADDGLGGIWLSAVAGESGERRALYSVAFAEQAAGL